MTLARRASSIQKELSPFQPLLTPIESLLSDTGAGKAFEHTFSDSVPVLMNALDEVAKVHVFLGGSSHHTIRVIAILNVVQSLCSPSRLCISLLKLAVRMTKR